MHPARRRTPVQLSCKSLILLRGSDLWRTVELSCKSLMRNGFLRGVELPLYYVEGMAGPLGGLPSLIRRRGKRVPPPASPAGKKHPRFS